MHDIVGVEVGNNMRSYENREGTTVNPCPYAVTDLELLYEGGHK